jgi:hypothetical protein
MLLHIADTILNAGPVWVYWVFVQERLCGRLQRAVTSRRHPYSSMNTWAMECEQLKLLGKQFELAERLRSLDSESHSMEGLYPLCEYRINFDLHPSHMLYPDPHAKLLPPRKKAVVVDPGIHRRIVAAIGTRYNQRNENIRHLVPMQLTTWSRLQRVDGGDLFRISSVVERTAGSYRDNSFIRVSTMIFIFALTHLP